MPKEVEDALKREAKKKGFKGERADRYVYGTMNKLGYMHGNKVVSEHPKVGIQTLFRRKGTKK